MATSWWVSQRCPAIAAKMDSRAYQMDAAHEYHQHHHQRQRRRGFQFTSANQGQFHHRGRDRIKGRQFRYNKIVTISTLNGRRWPQSQRLTWSSINTKLLSGTNPGIYLIITTMVKKSSVACSSDPNGKSNSCGMCCESCRFGNIKVGIQSGMNSTMHDPDCNPPGFNMLRTPGSIHKIVQPHDRTH